MKAFEVRKADGFLVWVRHGSAVGAGRWEPVGAMVAPMGSGERLVGRPRYMDRYCGIPHSSGGTLGGSFEDFLRHGLS